MEHHECTLCQILLCVICAFASFAMAEGWLFVSGVLSTMSAGITINALWRRDQQLQKMQSHLWEFMEYVLNVLLFTLAGTYVGVSLLDGFELYEEEDPSSSSSSSDSAHRALHAIHRSLNDAHSDDSSSSDYASGDFASGDLQQFPPSPSPSDVLISIHDALPAVFTSALLVVIYALVARAVVLLVLWPLLKKSCPALTRKDFVVLWWAGLRGAVGLLIAIEVAETPRSTSASPDGAPLVRQRTILLYVSSLTLVTLTFFAPTIGWLLRKLNMMKKAVSEEQQVAFLRCIVEKRCDDAQKAMLAKHSERFGCQQLNESILSHVVTDPEGNAPTPFEVAYNAIVSVSDSLSSAFRLRSTFSSNKAPSVVSEETPEPPKRGSRFLDQSQRSELGGSAELAWVRNLFLQVVRRRLAVYLDAEAASNRLTVFSYLEQIVEEELDSVKKPLQLWQRMQPRIRLHHAQMRRVNLVAGCLDKLRCWGRARTAVSLRRADSLGEGPSEDLLPLKWTTAAAVVGFVTVLDEAREELIALAAESRSAESRDVTPGDSLTASGSAVAAGALAAARPGSSLSRLDKLRPPSPSATPPSPWRNLKAKHDTPLLKLVAEVEGQIALAKEALEKLPTKHKVAQCTKQHATAVLTHRAEMVEGLSEAGLWPERSADHQLEKIKHCMLLAGRIDHRRDSVAHAVHPEAGSGASHRPSMAASDTSHQPHPSSDGREGQELANLERT